MPPAGGQTTKGRCLTAVGNHKDQRLFLNKTRDARTLQEFVELLGARGDLDDLSSPLVELCGCGETHGHQFGSFSLRRRDRKTREKQT